MRLGWPVGALLLLGQAYCFVIQKYHIEMKHKEKQTAKDLSDSSAAYNTDYMRTTPEEIDDELLHNGILLKNRVSVDEVDTNAARLFPNTLNSKLPNFKTVVVNEPAHLRHKSNSTAAAYGLPKDCSSTHPILSDEMEQFLYFMTQPTTTSQEAPIRLATAEVYMRHARLFLGWYLSRRSQQLQDPSKISLQQIFPSPNKQGAEPVVQFIVWLRTARHCSTSYEANVLRGLIKLCKFRFRFDSTADPGYGEKTFGDIGVIKELRKWHREAQHVPAAAKSSKEDRKWLSWSEYLGVIRNVKEELEGKLKGYSEKYDRTMELPGFCTTKLAKQRFYSQQRKIATLYQHYLILAIFACVPDRQRTLRELTLGTSFVRDDSVWKIEHGPDDYKTGKTYGPRPPMALSTELSLAVDDFVQHWRKVLLSKIDNGYDISQNRLFIQPRTGQPLTADSIYQIVARNCYQQTGQKTNPHLLRDMIVTHVRSSKETSEQQLEALALFMGHSVQMQKSSYDRRTMQTKVAPAVELLQAVNQQAAATRT